MKVEEIEKQYQENPDRFWGDIHIRTLLSRIRTLEEGIKDVIRMTDHMELNQLHIKRELQKLLEEIEA